MLLSGKVILVTGASRGIGYRMVHELAAEGAIVYANARTAGCLDDAVREVSSLDQGQIVPIYFDVTDEGAAKAAIMRIKKEQGKLDVLVNNAGIMKDANIGMINGTQMREVFDVNVFALLSLLQLAARVMMKQKSGSIINMASIVGNYGNSGQLVYSASKGAVIAATKTAAKELAKHGIRVNAIAPGMIDTDVFRSIGEDHQKERISNIGMGRIGTPLDVAKTCVYLASDLSEYVTGQIIGVDGAAIV